MLALARQGAVVLFGAFLLSPFLQALPATGEEDNCVHLVGYGGPGQQSLAQPSRLSNPNGQGGGLAAGICAVDNARVNRSSPTKTNADFVPITGDDALGFYCVYGVRASTSGGVAGNVGIFLFELAGGEVLVFGSGYGNIAGANLFDAAYDMERVDQVIRFCMGKDPAQTALRLVVPHGHGDHINPACNRELERLGYRILEIVFHQGDSTLVNAMAWTSADRALFRVLAPSTTCLQELTSYSSPLGKIWFFDRPGHTPGSIDLVIDAQNDPTNRFVVRGSQPSSACAVLPGQREIINAHGNVELLSTPPTLSDVTPLVGTALGGTALALTGLDFNAPQAGTHRVLFNGVPATEVVVVSDTSLTCKTPPGPPGQLVEVAVVNNNGQSIYSGTFFYNALPTLTSLSPVSGDWRGGTVVQVRGSGFVLSSGINEVFFGARKATSLSIKSDTLLTCRTPSGTQGTTVTVQLRNPNGQASLANSFRYNTDLSITDVVPASSTALGGETILLTGTLFTGSGGAPLVTIGGVPATTVTLISDTSVSLVSPPGAPGATVDLVLTNSSGSATFSGFRYHAVPLLSAVTPASGRATGGSLVTLSGDGFLVDRAGANQVRFGGRPANQVTVLTDESLTCLAPTGTVGTVVNVTVTNKNGTATLPLAYTYMPPLSASSLAPSSGGSPGGTQVTITGSGFLDGPAGTSSVRFGGLAATQVTALTDGTLSCLAPAGTPLAVVDVEISNANGTATLSAAYRYHARPTLTALTPNHGHAGTLTPVTLSGTGFLAEAAGVGLVVVGGIAASDVEVLSDTQLECSFPQGNPGATVDVIFANQNGSASLPSAFRYHTAPSVTAVSPVSGPAGSQPRVTVTGAGFLNDQAGTPVVSFGGLVATSVSVQTDQTLRCNAPVGPAGQVVSVAVTNARGTGTLTGAYRYHARPALTAATPNRGTFQGGTQITLSGTGFQVDGAGANVITFGGALAGNVVTLNDTTVRCTTPPGTLNEQVDVVLSNVNGTGTLVRGFSYSVQPPAVLSVTPPSGPAHAPGTVQIAGSGFVNDSAGTNTVQFGSVASGSVTVINDATLSCQVPPGTSGTTVNVVVSNANGTGQLAPGFRYHARPVLTSLTPASASAAGGATLQLAGSGFQVDAAGPNLVTFGGTSATSVQVVNDGTLSCVVPAGLPATTVDVQVSNANGQAATRSFGYHAQPSLSALTPTFGPASGGTRITLTGLGFLLNNAGVNTVTVGGKPAQNVAVLSDTTLACDAPRGDPGYVDVALRNANGSALLPGAYHFGRLPLALTSVDPASGPDQGRNLVTLKGRAFQAGGAGTNRVKFGDVLSSNVIVVDDETLLCAAPAGTPGTIVDVALNNNSGTVVLAQSYRYHLRPTLSAITPTEGLPLGETLVTLTGSGFAVDAPGVTTVLFGMAHARDVSVVDDAHLTCTALGGSPGTTLDVTVRNANGSATLADAYRVIAGAPTLSELAPKQGPFVGGTRVELAGTGFDASPVAVTFGGVLALDLIVVDDTRLSCLTPPGTIGQAVNVALQTSNGIVVALEGFTYTATLPLITALAPNHGPSSGGTRVTISGSGFASANAGLTRVSFDGVAAGNVLVLNDGTVTCDAPPGAAGKRAEVVLQNDNGSSTRPRGFRYHAQPTLTGLTPAVGLADGGTNVTLTGKGFSVDAPGKNQVRFGGASALGVVVVSDQILTCTTPPGLPATTVDVVLTNLNGSVTQSSAFRYNAKPEIDALSPTRGPKAGGTELTLVGRGFQADSAGLNQVTFGGVPALLVSTLDDATITCVTPPKATSGSVDVVVVNANGRSIRAGAFAYFVPPTLTALAPDHGPAEGGTSVTLTGLGFLEASPGTNLVLFGGVAANDVVELSDTTLTCTAPAGPAGVLVDVTLANENGIATLAGAFRYLGAPVLSALTPDHGPADGALVTVTGSGFLTESAGANTLAFGGVPATNVTVLDDATLTCRAPAGTPGAVVDAVITNAIGSATLAAAYRYHREPTLTNVAPNRGPAAGGTTVTLTGSGFQLDEPGKASVIFGGFGASDVVVLSDTTLTCTSPGGFPNTLVNVTVVNDNGADVRVNAFRYNALPALGAVTPASGGAQGGTFVTLSGSGFGVNNPGPNTVLFGATPASAVSVVGDATLTCLAPAGTAGTTVDVSVSNANGSAALAGAYRFNAAPSLSALAPVSASALGGALVTLTGSGFADPAAGATLVTFGGASAADVIVLDGARVQCAAPAGTPGSLVEVRLVNANGEASLASAFRYHALPTLAAILPARGSSAASSSLTLQGSGFLADGAGPNQVSFGAVPATSVVVVDDTTLTCAVAPQPAGTVVDVHVSNQNGSAQLAAAFAFDAPAPVLASVDPASGIATGGTTVTLLGAGFQDFSAGANTVTFGGVQATGVVVVSDTTLQCQTPPGTVGATVDVALANVNGSALLAAAFDYVAPAPILAGLTPANGPAAGGGTVTLTGSGFQVNGAGLNSVTFGGVAASSVSVLGDTTLTCLVPPGAGGTSVDVELGNANGSARLPAGYRYHALPVITSITPVDGTSLGGTLITVRGAGFLNDSAGVNQIRFGATAAATVVVLEDGRLTCRVPSGTAGAVVTVSLSNQNGAAQLVNAFRYHARPTLTAVTPPDGTALGANRVTLTGTGFLADGAVVNIVAFGGTTATGVTVVNDRTIQCNVPAGTSGLSVQVSVANVNGTALLPNGYRYHATPTLTAATPPNGPTAGGTLITLTGSGFALDSPGANGVTFGGVAATSVSVLGDTQLTCLTPAGSIGTTVDIVLSNANGAGTLFAGFTYDSVPVPIVNTALPSKGTTQGSTPVTLTGAGFVPGMSVSFGTSAALDVVVVDARTITCLTPASTNELWVDVTVSDATTSTSLPLGFQYVGPPTLNAVLPPVGDPAGGSMVVLEGSGFRDDGAGTNRVTFAGREAAAVTVLDDQHLSCFVPDGPTFSDADIVLSNDNGTAQLVRGFRWQLELATDLDRDGRGDLVLGSPGDDTVARDAGAVHVFFGSALPLLDRSAAQAELTALPGRAATAFGTPVVSGDLDGDGQAELVIGAPADDQRARDAGAVYVFAGPLVASSAPLLPSQARIVLSSARTNDRLGSALVLCDLDRNGFLDLLAGAPGRAPGTVCVFLGGPAGLNATASLLIYGEFGSEGFARSLAAGDLDGDGWPEIVVGAPTAQGDLALSPTGNNWNPGEVRVYRGGLALLSAVDPDPWLVFSGQEEGEGFGSTLAARDLTGDGIADLIVGSPSSSRSGSASGSVSVFFGRGDLTAAQSGAAQAILTAEAAGDRLGSALAAGDVDGDGLADLLVGAPGHAGSGRAYLHLGRDQLSHRSSAAAEAVLEGETGSSSEFGSTVALVDVDGDGHEDLVVTAPAFGGELGRVYVFDGSAVLGGREAASSDGKLTGRSAGDRLGQATSSDH